MRVGKGRAAVLISDWKTENSDGSRAQLATPEIKRRTTEGRGVVACVSVERWHRVASRDHFCSIACKGPTVILALLTGSLAGFLHVFSGPDHLAAVAPLAAVARGSSWRAGLRWGIGHSSGVAIIGLLLILLRETIPIERFSSVAEALVGVTLLGIGGWSLRRALSTRLHAHVHAHGSEQHVHLHLHGALTSHPPQQIASHRHGHTAIAVGTLHGLAGSSHLFVVLPALALPGFVGSLVYLLAFGAGTVVAMILFAQGIGWILLSTSRWGIKPYRIALATLSVIAMMTGGYWLFQVGGGIL